MPLGLILGIGRTGRKRASSLDILSSKRAPRDYLLRGQELQVYRFPHSQRYVVMQEKLPNYVVPDLTDFKLKPYVFQCPRDIKTAEAAESAK